MRRLNNRIEILNAIPNITPATITAMKQLLGHHPNGITTDTYQTIHVMTVNHGFIVALVRMCRSDPTEFCPTGYALEALVSSKDVKGAKQGWRRLQLKCPESGETHSINYNVRNPKGCTPSVG